MKEVYDWVPWFQELAKKIYDGSESDLAEKAKRVKWKADDAKTDGLLQYGDENIDPLSFFYTLSSRGKWKETRKRVYSSVSREFGLSQKIDLDSDDSFMFRKANPQKYLLHNGENFNPQLLWKIFRAAVSGLDAVVGDDFENALKLPSVGFTNLTQALSLVNPGEFLPMDNHFKSLGIFDLDSNNKSWEEYRQCIERVRNVFRGCELYEARLFSYLHFTGKLHVRLDPDPHQHQYPYYQYNAEDESRWSELDKSNSISDAGGDGRKWMQQQKYQGPQPGQIVLARTWNTGRGIGIIWKNDYQGQAIENLGLHVVWLNKLPAQLYGKMPSFDFSWAVKSSTTFLQVQEYAPTFELLERLNSEKGEGEETPLSKESNPKTVIAAPSSREIRPKMDVPKNRILYGPPGTGKTWSTVNRALEILDPGFYEANQSKRGVLKQRFNELQKEGRIGFVTFHQSFSYEDFVEGLRASTKKGKIRYQIEDGLFKRMCDSARKHPDEPQVLIVDEINRGNIANILGELITLIEPSKRAGAEDEITVNLPYSKALFSVPDNLYIIGTMNTADRSLTHLDTALRRRFEFEAMLPDTEPLQGIEIDGINISKMLKVINSRIELLLDRERTLGHSFFLPLKENPDLGTLKRIFKNSILPLLEEYCFEDWSRIRKVLGDDRKAEEKLMFYVSAFKPGRIDQLLGEGEDNQGLYDKVFRRNEKAMDQAEAWIGIYKEQEPQQKQEPAG